MDYKCHIYDVSGVHNMRDIGGYRAGDGRVTAKGRFIRSASLYGLGSAGGKALREIGVDCVVDLRSRAERSSAPYDVVRDGIHMAHVPMLDYISSNFASGDFTNFPDSMTEMYIGLIQKGGDDFKTIFELFADSRFESCLFHCTAGKDRTGVTTMLLLGLADIPDEDIIEDYTVTEKLQRKKRFVKPPDNIPSYLLDAKPETMRDTIGFVRENYGGVREYLESIGVEEKTLNRVREKLFGSL